MYDGLILGAGAIGLSLAYELAQHGWKVRVVDRGEPGREASWAGAGILPPANQQHARDPLEQLRGLSCRLHVSWAEQLRAETGIDTGYRACGGIHVARQPGEVASLKVAVRDWSAEGIESIPLDAAGLRQREPALAAFHSGQVTAAYWLPGEAQLRNPWHMRALLRACEQRGVEISQRQEVLGWETEHGSVTAVKTARGALRARTICVAAGAWTTALLQPLGLRLELRPWRGQMALLGGPRGLLQHVINEGPRYLVPRDDGRVLVGSTMEDVGFDKSTTPHAVAQLVQFAHELVPDLRSAPIEQSWAGLRPGTGDGMPYLGRMPGYDNLFVAAGHFRNGLYLSPATAVVMGQIMREQAPAIDLTMFRPARG